MQREEKVNRLNELCSKYEQCWDGCPLVKSKCGGCFEYSSPEEIDGWYDKAFPNIEPKIKDSGERREFGTGAVRDIQVGKGRCDLLPLDVVYGAYDHFGVHDEPIYLVFDRLQRFIDTGNHKVLYEALACFRGFDSIHSMFLEVSKHFEEGNKKYPPNADNIPNWKLGIPTRSYIDSATRHYLKWLRGDKDEPHDRAFVWNLLCCIWTCIHKPELNDYLVQNNNGTEG